MDEAISLNDGAVPHPYTAHRHRMNHRADGVIQIEWKDYDDLLAERPAAALRYVDEDDGEVVMVSWYLKFLTLF